MFTPLVRLTPESAQFFYDIVYDVLLRGATFDKKAVIDSSTQITDEDIKCLAFKVRRFVRGVSRSFGNTTKSDRESLVDALAQLIDKMPKAASEDRDIPAPVKELLSDLRQDMGWVPITVARKSYPVSSNFIDDTVEELRQNHTMQHGALTQKYYMNVIFEGSRRRTELSPDADADLAAAIERKLGKSLSYIAASWKIRKSDEPIVSNMLMELRDAKIKKFQAEESLTPAEAEDKCNKEYISFTTTAAGRHNFHIKDDAIEDIKTRMAVLFLENVFDPDVKPAPKGQPAHTKVGTGYSGRA